MGRAREMGSSGWEYFDTILLQETSQNGAKEVTPIFRYVHLFAIPPSRTIGTTRYPNMEQLKEFVQWPSALACSRSSHLEGTKICLVVQIEQSFAIHRTKAIIVLCPAGSGYTKQEYPKARVSAVTPLSRVTNGYLHCSLVGSLV